MIKTLAVFTVAWHDRAALIDKAAGYIKSAWRRVKDNARYIQPLALLFLLVALFVVITARVKLDNDRIREAQETAAAEEMRLDLEKQEAIRASMVASEQAKAQEAAAAHRADCEAVARVLYGTALHHSEDAQKAVVWCIINRAESSLYPDSIQEVCEQPSQWMGYSDSNPIIESLYEIADEVLSGWESGGYRAISPDYLFLTWTRDEIVLKTTFTDGKNTHYWRVS